MRRKRETCTLKEQKEPTLEEKTGMDKEAGTRLWLCEEFGHGHGDGMMLEGPNHICILLRIVIMVIIIIVARWMMLKELLIIVLGMIMAR